VRRQPPSAMPSSTDVGATLHVPAGARKCALFISIGYTTACGGFGVGSNLFEHFAKRGYPNTVRMNSHLQLNLEISMIPARDSPLDRDVTRCVFLCYLHLMLPTQSSPLSPWERGRG
jgi:hypothetical protein